MQGGELQRADKKSGSFLRCHLPDMLCDVLSDGAVRDGRVVAVTQQFLVRCHAALAGQLGGDPLHRVDPVVSL